MQNSMEVFTFSVLLFLGKFCPENQNCQFKLKFGTKTNSNMQNSMMMFTFFVFNNKYPSWANLIQKFQNFLFKVKFDTKTNSNIQN